MNFENMKSGVLISPIKATDRPSYVLCGANNTFEESYVNPLLENSPTYNQGQTEMCVAFSLSLSRWLVEQVQSHDTLQYSPGMIYSNRETYQWQGEGMYLNEALDNLVKYGVCHYDDFLISGKYDICKKLFDIRKNDLIEKGHPFRVSSWYRCYSDNDIKQAIKKVGFVIVSLPMYDTLYSPDKSTNMVDFKISNIHGYHAVILAGWNKNGWIMKNSWGKEYGNNGVCTLSYKYPMSEAYTYIDEVREVEFMLENKFKDINDAPWAKDAIEKCINAGIMNGYKDDETGEMTIKPNQNITRAEIAAILVRLGLIKN